MALHPRTCRFFCNRRSDLDARGIWSSLVDDRNLAIACAADPWRRQSQRAVPASRRPTRNKKNQSHRPKRNWNRIPIDVSLGSRKEGLATQLGTSADMPHRVSYRFPLRTASTTSRIASITSFGCSLCISWPLFVLVICFSLGTSLASRSCAFFCAASVI